MVVALCSRMRAAPQAIGDGPWSDEQKEALHAALLSSDKGRVNRKRGVMQQCLFFENPSGFAMPREWRFATASSHREPINAHARARAS